MTCHVERESKPVNCKVVAPPNITRRPEQFISDDRRVITRLFLPGSDARIVRIIDRVCGMSDEQVTADLADIMRDFETRHRHVDATFDRNARAALEHAHLIDDVSPSRLRLLGAYFTMEYSIESAALFNPSIVPHVDQSGVPEGAMRFIMSLRATGEGHISSIAFRTGVIGTAGDISFDLLSRFVARAKPDWNAPYVKKTFFLKLIEMGAYNDIVGELLDALPDEFSHVELDRIVRAMHSPDDASALFQETVENVLWLARSNYHLVFPPDCPISEVVVFPVTENESRGIEDARFVRFTDDDGSVTYYGSYTAYNGYRILPQLLQTDDFSRFRIITLNGSRVQNKGMALFPRRIKGEYKMIGRLDGENLFLMTSRNIRFWNEADILRGPEHPWEFVQIGNCGSPIETEHGWILLTHGVGPMRRYCIGVMLLDLEDPSRIIRCAEEPLLIPNEKEREGYVPNVVYSCGALLHNGNLIIPYAMADSATSIATISLDDLMAFLNA